MNDLANKKCIPCETGGAPLTREEAQDYLDEVPGWQMNGEAKRISKEYKFRDFVEAIDFVNRVADIAEMEGHHPDIFVHYNKVRLDLFTHAVSGLSENDFILASKIDSHN